MKKTFLIWLLGGILVLPILCQEFEGEEEMDPSDFLKNEKVQAQPAPEEGKKEPPPALEKEIPSEKTRNEEAQRKTEEKSPERISPKASPPDIPKPIRPSPIGPPIEEEKEEPSSSDIGRSGAPVRIDEERTTRYITFSGFVGFSFNFRDDFFADAVLGNNSTGLDEDHFDPRIMLRMDIQMANNIKGVLEVQNERRDSILHRSSAGNLYVTNRSSDNRFQFEFEKAYIQIDHFLTKGLKFKGGLIPQKYALRADGQAFFLNLGEAESPFSTREDTHALGTVLTFQPVQALEFYMDAFYFVTSESGFDRKDETIAGVNLDFYMPKALRGNDGSSITLARFFNLMFSTIQGDNKNEIWNVGFGFDYFFTGDPGIYTVELYGEAIFQFGEYNRKGRSPAFSEKDQDHLAFGTYVGTKFKYEKSGYKPFLDVSFWYLSGDDDEPSRKKNHDFVSYEDIDSTLILEENDYGLDIDSNYWALKFKSGFKLNPLLNEEVRLEVLYAHFKAIDVPRGKSRRMGEEVDLRLIWEYSPDLTFSLAAGFLFNSRYLDQVFDEVGARGKSGAFLLRFESMLRF